MGQKVKANSSPMLQEFCKKEKSYLKLLYFESFCTKSKKVRENVMPVFQVAKHTLGELFNLKIVFGKTENYGISNSHIHSPPKHPHLAFLADTVLTAPVLMERNRDLDNFLMTEHLVMVV